MLGSTSIDGLASGLNTTEIVNAIIQFERRNAILMEFDQAQRTNIISSYKALQAKLLAFNSQVNILTNPATFNKVDINVSDDTFLTASAAGKAALGNFDIQVLAVARNDQIASQGFDDASKSAFGTGTISITVGDGSQKTITIDSTNNSLIGIKTAINNAEIGVTATIINDGSSSNPFRLMISVDNTGAANSIAISTTLSGGSNLNYSTAVFDVPEALSMDTGSSSKISLGSTASYSGTTNKIYTFTVAGSGSQTIGTDNITINWTDGTDSGSIVVTQADTEFALAGTGSNGLKLSFSAGALNAGDTFQVQTFAPVLQKAADASIAFGSTGGSGGSPIIVSSDTNTFKDVIEGITLTTKKITKTGEFVSVSAELDVASIRSTINSFITRYNDVMSFIDKQNSYDPDREEGGILLGDTTLHRLQSQIRNTIASKVTGTSGSLIVLSSIGIRTGFNGKLSIKNSSALDDALLNNLDDVIKLFGNSGSTTSTQIEFISANAQTKAGSKFDVDITQIATQGKLQGVSIVDPAATPLILTSSNNRLKFTISGVISDEIILTQKTYSSGTELADEIQRKLNADAKVGTRGATVEWVDTGSGNGLLRLTTSQYGKAASITLITSVGNSAFAALGLATGESTDGQDVAGTINGESATGLGLFLTGDDDNANTDGLKLKITLTSTQLVGGAEATVTVAKGVASKLNELVDSFTKSGTGLMDSRIKAVQGQVDLLGKRIEEFDARLERRRDRLFKQFLEMELALGNFQIQSQFLDRQLAMLNTNFVIGRK